VRSPLDLVLVDHATKRSRGEEGNQREQSLQPGADRSRRKNHTLLASRPSGERQRRSARHRPCRHGTENGPEVRRAGNWHLASESRLARPLSRATDHVEARADLVTSQPVAQAVRAFVREPDRGRARRDRRSPLPHH